MINSFFIHIILYNKALRNDDICQPVDVIPPQHQLLNADDEMLIIEIIHEQLLFDCWVGKDIRNYASQIYKQLNFEEKVLTRDWMNDFKDRHNDDIEKVSVDTLNETVKDISIEEVNR